MKKIRNEFTTEQIKKAVEMAKMGHTIEVMCTAIGIDKTVYYNKLKQYKAGTLESESENNFYNEVLPAINEFFINAELTVTQGAFDSPQFALEVLSRRRAHIWGKKDYLRQNIKGKIEIEEKYDESLLDEKITELLKRNKVNKE
jgi:hypothetical protein